MSAPKLAVLTTLTFLAALPARAEVSAAPATETNRDELIRVQRLESLLQLENLQAQFGYYLDKGDWKKAALLFTSSATYEWGQGGVYRGRDHIRRALTLFGPEGLRTGQLNNFMMLQPIVTVSNDNRTAKARWRSVLELSDAGKGRWGEGTYENEYVRESDGWRISKLHFYVTILDRYEDGPIKGAEPLPGPSTVVPPDSAPTVVYRPMPEGYFPRYHFPNPGEPVLAFDRPASVVPHAGSASQGVSAKLDRLEAEAAIERVERAYGYYVDKNQHREISKLFSKDGTLEIGGRGVFVGPDRIFEYFDKGLGGDGFKPGGMPNHMQLQPIVTVSADGQTAKARWSAFVMAANAIDGHAVWGDVSYENEYVKEDGVWKISKLDAPFNMYTVYEQGWAKFATPNTRPESFLPPPDLPPSRITLTYPNFYVQPYHYPNPVTGRHSPEPNPRAGGVASMKAPLSPPSQ